MISCSANWPWVNGYVQTITGWITGLYIFFFFYLVKAAAMLHWTHLDLVKVWMPPTHLTAHAFMCTFSVAFAIFTPIIIKEQTWTFFCYSPLSADYLSALSSNNWLFSEKNWPVAVMKHEVEIVRVSKRRLLTCNSWASRSHCYQQHHPHKHSTLAKCTLKSLEHHHQTHRGD